VTIESRVDLETLYYEAVSDGVVQLTLNRPDRGNGVVPELARDLLHTWEALEGDLDVRAVVLTGAGKVFSAGADLVAMRAYLDDVQPVTGEPYNAKVLFPVTQRIVLARLPVIAAINGGATAGGLDLALACDIRVCSERAKLGETYINMALPLGNGGSWFLPRLIGTGMASELALTGELVSARRALEIGLVNHVVPHEELLPRSIELAAKIAAKPRRAVEATRQALRSGWQLDLQAAMSANYWMISDAYHGADIREGVAAFLERREPQFHRKDSE
jgi:enoyl-CoA hydratase